MMKLRRAEISATSVDYVLRYTTLLYLYIGGVYKQWMFEVRASLVQPRIKGNLPKGSYSSCWSFLPKQTSFKIGRFKFKFSWPHTQSSITLSFQPSTTATLFSPPNPHHTRRAIERMGRVPDNIVISPGPGRPEVPEDFGMCAQALREATDIPILGVCLGHEGLGVAHGASVVRAAEPMHGRLSPIFHDGEDALFRDVPQGSRVVRYHSLVVDRETLPAGPGGAALRATAWTGDGVLMAMRHEERPHWGVQFHPESVGTRHGSHIVRNFRDLTVAWRGAAVAAAREMSGGGGGGGGGDGDVSLTQSLGVAREASGGVVRNGWRRSGARAETAAVGDGPVISSSDLSLDNKGRKERVFSPALDEATVGAAPAPPRRLDGSGDSSTAGRKRRSLILRVEEVDMTGADADARSTDSSSRSSSPSAGSAMPDTEHAFRALYGDDPTAWWLDSSSQRPGLAVDGQAKARFTFMGGADGPLSQTIECYGEGRLVVQQGAGGNGEGGGGKRREIRANIMDYLKAEMAKVGHSSNGEESLNGYGTITTSNNGLEIRMVGGRERDAEVGGDPVRATDDGDQAVTLPFDFVGGFVGFLGYELRHEANNVLVRSAGGTEWDWQPPDGGLWQEATFDSEKTIRGAPGGLAEGSTASDEAPTGGGRGDGAEGGGPGAAAAPRDYDGGSGGGVGAGDVPLGFLVFVDRFVAFDHQEGKAYVLALSRADASLGGGGGVDDVGHTDAWVADGIHAGAGTTATSTTDEERDTLDWIHCTAESLRGLSLSSPSAVFAEKQDCGVAAAEAAAAASRGGDAAVAATTACAMDIPRSRYEQSLEEIMRLVEEGETYEVCLTNQIVCERPKGGDGGVAAANKTPPLDLYSRLRRSNPAPYAAYIVHDPQRRLSPAPSAGGDDAGEAPEAESGGGGGGGGPAFAVCCSSPEKFLKVDGHGWVESKPIKGTVKR